jgi:hypothetical protein
MKYRGDYEARRGRLIGRLSVACSERGRTSCQHSPGGAHQLGRQRMASQTSKGPANSEKSMPEAINLEPTFALACACK